MDRREVGRDGVDWMDMAQDRGHIIPKHVVKVKI
jgi:hypothetical protein